MGKNKRTKLIFLRILLASMMVGIAVLLVYLIFRSSAPGLMPAIKDGDTEAIEKYLESNANVKGMILTAVLQIVQVISIVIPSLPIQVAAGVVFGVLKGFIICHIANVIGNCIVYVAYSRMSSKLNDIVPINNQNKAVKFIQSSSSTTFMIAMTCLIPAVPNGFVPYAAVLVDVPLKKFAFAVWAGSAFPVFMMCLIGRRILAGDYITVILLTVFTFAAAVFLTIKQKKIIGFVHGITDRFRK